MPGAATGARSRLHAKIGQLIVEREVRKMSTPDRPALVNRGYGELSVRRQCQLLGIARSGIYRLRSAANDDDDPALLWRIDELFTTWPFLGSRLMAMLRAEGHAVNRKLVQRLMRASEAERRNDFSTLMRRDTGKL
jgi:hypothetical protein